MVIERKFNNKAHVLLHIAWYVSWNFLKAKPPISCRVLGICIKSGYLYRGVPKNSLSNNVKIQKDTQALMTWFMYLWKHRWIQENVFIILMPSSFRYNRIKCVGATNISNPHFWYMQYLFMVSSILRSIIYSLGYKAFFSIRIIQTIER